MFGLVLVTAGIVGVAAVGMDTLSHVRAYVGGEARWSKAQKSAVHDLVRYAATHDETEYQRFVTELQVPLGGRRARLELERPVYDARVVH